MVRGVGTPFITALSYGFIGGGVGDILSGGLSIINGVPINLDGYLKSKPMSLALNLALSGIAYIGQAVVPSLPALSAPASMSQHIMEQFAFQATLMAASHVMQQAGNNMLDSNDGELESDIHADVDRLLKSHEEELRIIFSSDPAIINDLAREAHRITKNYANKYNTEFANAAKTMMPSVMRNFGWTTAIASTVAVTSVTVAAGAIRAHEATDDFADKFGEVIANTARTLHPAKLIDKKELDSRMQNFGDNLSSLLFTQVKGIYKTEVIGAFANLAGTFFGEYVTHQLHKHIEARKTLAMLEREANQVYAPKVIEAPKYEVVGGEQKGSVGTGDSSKPTFYEVKPGDSLSKIAKEHGTTVDELAKLNGIKDPNKILAGITIKLPAGAIYIPGKPANDNNHKQGQNKFPATTSDSNYIASKASASAYNADYAVIDRSVDALKVSGLDKDAMKKDLHKFVDQLKNASPEDRQKVMADLYSQANPTEKSLFAKISDSIIPSANAFGPATPAVLAVSNCLANPACSALLVGTAISVYSKILTEVQILSTPEHRDEGSVLSTPIHTEGSHDQGFGIWDGTKFVDQGLSMPSYDNTLPGFAIYDGDDMNILFNIKIDSNGKLDLSDFDIKNHEGQAHNGHTEIKHIDKKIEYLKGRFADPQVKASTTYYNEETANKVIKGVLEQNEKAFVNWAQNSVSTRQETFEGNFKENIGEGLKPGETSLTPRNKALVVVRKTQNGLKIITSYPVE